VVHFLQTRVINPRVRRHAGSPGNRYALLETIGRRTGQPRQTPVANGLDGSVFWIVAEYGWAADYVRNLVANPRVRVRVDGSWRTGTARPLPDDDPVRRLTSLDPRTAREIQRLGMSLLTIRVDLDPLGA
jgi:deazaflavin-dependent oxidoreductase (nitroreductase family)